ncbi:MAG TPA: hypothetical protein VGC91_08145 [Pyrinomonadaceae bacterium]|jgi:hypothetical protein
MRFFIRLLASLLTFAVGLTTVAVWSVFQPSSQPAQTSEAVSVAITGMNFFGWRGETPSGLELESSKFSSAVPTYYRLESWHAADPSQPGMIDVVFHLENHGSQPVSLMVIAIGKLNSIPHQAEGTSEAGRIPLLTEQQNIGQRVIRDLAPGESREITFAGIDLKEMANKYLRKEFGRLRPFELMVKIDVSTLDNKQVAELQSILPLSFER